jgi:hypothetical protein
MTAPHRHFEDGAVCFAASGISHEAERWLDQPQKMPVGSLSISSSSGASEFEGSASQ